MRKLTIDEETQELDENEELLKFPVGVLVLITFIWIFICAGIFLLFETSWTYGTKALVNVIVYSSLILR